MTEVESSDGSTSDTTGEGGKGGHPPDKLLPPAEARAAALLTLQKISKGNASRNAMARVAAAKAILDETAPNYEKLLLKMFDGDDEKLEAWLVAELEACRKRMAKR